MATVTSLLFLYKEQNDVQAFLQIFAIKTWNEEEIKFVLKPVSHMQLIIKHNFNAHIGFS